MQITQISVFLENNIGRIGEVTKVLADTHINMRAISIADTADFGILRLIVNNPEQAVEALNIAGFTTKETAVVAIELEDIPGSLAKILEVLQKSKVNIEYLYTTPDGGKGKVMVIFKLEDPVKGMQILRETGFSTLNVV